MAARATPRFRPTPGSIERIGRAALAASLAVLIAVLAACGSDQEAGSLDGIVVPEGYEVSEVVSGLDGPTQIQVLDDGRLLVAQLNGDEGKAVGQVLRVDPETGDREVIADDLVSPTGVAAVGDDLWVMERRRLSHGSLTSGDLETVLDDLPFNGRSEGTLTPLDDGRLLYHTSGSISSGRATEGSGTVWVIDAAAVTEGSAADPQPVAIGFKNAYARVVTPDGALWLTEVADGTFDGEQAPDELVAVPKAALEAAVDHGPADPADGGWPRCVGDRRPVVEFGGTAETCADTLGAAAVFEPGATPTSVAVPPWDDDTLLVALWNDGKIVSVPADASGHSVEPTTWMTGVDHPQHLEVDGQRLLVVDFTAGRILGVGPSR